MASENSEAPATVAETVPVNHVTETATSWVSVAQDKQTLKKYEVDISTQDGVHSVEIPDGVLEKVTPLWEDFLVGKYLDMAPHVAKVHVILNKVWNYGDTSSKIDVYEVNNTTMRFRVRNPKSRERILRKGMWNIAEVPMVVTKWTLKAEEEKQEEDSIPMWVHVKKVPLHMFSWEGLSFITSAVGHPVKLHPDTLACTSFEVAKVFVKVDVSKVLPKAINFSKNGTEFMAEFIYPWLPSRCNLCDKWGYVEKVCVMNKDDAKNPPEGDKEVIQRRTEVAEAVNDPKTDNEVAVIALGSTDDMGNPDKVDTEGIKDSWLEVSPSKIGRSPMRSPTRKQLEEPFISASKFYVLSTEEEDEEGETNDATSGNAIERDATGEEEDISVVEDLTENKPVEDDSQRVQKQRGTKKVQNKMLENSALALDVNPVAMSTRSSRHHL